MKFSLIGITIVALLGVLAGLIYQTADGVLFGLSWAYATYKFIKAIWIIFWKLPKRQIHRIPRGLTIPEHITRENLPYWRGEIPVQASDVRQLIDDIVRKIGHAADESAVRGFVQDRLATMRDKIESRYSHAKREIDVIAYEGMIGTLLSLVTFMVQGKVLFQIPASGDSAELIAKMSDNLRSIDLVTVASGFVASIFGWMVKTYVGGVMEYRKDLEHEDLTGVEEWLQREIFARLKLENISTIVVPAVQEASSNLERGLVEMMRVTRDIQGMIEKMGRVTRILSDVAEQTGVLVELVTHPDGFQVESTFVQGAVHYTLRVPEDISTVSVSEETGGTNGEA